jgi:excinuclease ABC subunit C
MKELYGKLPQTPGVYVMRGARNKVLYIGKAVNLRRRVSSYFLRAHDARIETLVSQIKRIDHFETDNAIEALILEAKLIKQYQPPFNIREKDDKSFLFVEITREPFPRVLLVRGTEKKRGMRYGPFVSAMEVRKALKVLRKIFPFHLHKPEQVGTFKRPCFDYEIGLCPGTCVGAISKEAYRRNIRNIRYILQGKKKHLLTALKREMKMASKTLRFEEAERIRRQIFALDHLRDTAFIRNDLDVIVLPGEEVKKVRIEGYDISTISGTSAVGSMVVFVNDVPMKDLYRKFKIRTVAKPDDVGMLEEVLRRRLGNDWELPDLILVDGGLGQAQRAKKVLSEHGLSIPVLGIVKGPDRKRNDIIGLRPKHIPFDTLVAVRDEAHRFAIRYHRELRGKNALR